MRYVECDCCGERFWGEDDIGRWLVEVGDLMLCGRCARLSAHQIRNRW